MSSAEERLADHKDPSAEGKHSWAIQWIATSIGATVFVIAFVGLCVCWKWRKRKNRLLRDGSSSSSSSKNGFPSAKKVSQAGVTGGEAIAFVLPSINFDLGEQDSSAGETKADGGSRMSVTRCSRQTDTWLSIPTGNIDREMYVSSEGDEATTPSVTGLGKVGLNVRYDIVLELLKVRVVAATNLPAKFRKNAADPHAKVTLLPDKTPKFYTKIQRNTLNPIFGDEFAFEVPHDKVEEKILRVAMCDLDRFSRRVILGYVCIPLPEIGIRKALHSSVCTGDIWRDLYDSCDRALIRTEGNKGDLFLSLSYNPDTGVLVVGIHKAKNIQTVKKDKDIASVYAKVTLFVSGKFIKSKKTSNKKKTLEPEFEESFAIQLPRDRLQSFHVIVALCARTRLGGRCVLGRTQIGAFAFVSGPGFDHWLDALNSPKSIVAQWHILS